MSPKDKTTNKLNEAISLFQFGKIELAQKILTTINTSKRAPALSWFISAIIHAQKSEVGESIRAFKKAILLQPQYPDAHNNLGVILEAKGSIDEAKKHYNISIKQRPGYASALFNLGNIYHKEKKFELAEKFYQRAIESEPNHTKALNNIGLLYQQSNKPQKAMTALQGALNTNPNDHEILNNIGHQYHLGGNFNKALQCYQHANQLHPNNPEILNNIGVTLLAIQQYPEAEKNLKHAINLQHNYHQAITSLANLYSETGDSSQAKALYLEALKICPESSAANNNYGLTFHKDGHYDIAKTYFELAINNDENDNEAKYNLCTNQLANGLFTEGWKNYQFRPTIRHPLSHDINTITKNDLNNKSVLLLKEQGIGDELFFLRFANQLSQICKSISYLCTGKITPFVQQISAIDTIYTHEKKISHYDIAISIGDLPSLLVQKDNNIPQTIALNTLTEYEIELHDMLKSFGPPPYIGITWRGGQQEKNLLFKSIPIPDILNSIRGISGTFVSLQRKPTQDELAELKLDSQFSSIPDLNHLNEDLPRMLTLLSLLDDYIGVSNTNTHLRAALGKSAKVLIPHPPEWRWMFSMTYSPWFPEFEIFRQNPDGNWDNALSKLHSSLLSK